MATRNSTGRRDSKRSVTLNAVDTHFAGLRGDIDAQRAITAATAVVELVDALQEEGAGLRLDKELVAMPVERKHSKRRVWESEARHG
jgi:hypothetical protein